MKTTKISILMAVFLIGLLTGCSNNVTNTRTDEKLESLRQEREASNTEAEGIVKSYILSEAELNSANSYKTVIQQTLEQYTDSEHTEDGQLRITTKNDSDRKDVCKKMTTFQKQIIEDAQKIGCTITFDGNLVNVVVPSDVNKDISDYINAICVAGGLIERVEKGYAEWSFDINITNDENERLAYQTVTNDQAF